MSTRIIIAPVIPAAVSALVSFYSLHGLRLYIPSSFIYGGLLVCTVLTAAVLLHINGRGFVLAMAAGIIAGSCGESVVRMHQQPPKTLLPLHSVTGTVLMLTGEPVPAGSGSYSIAARILSCCASDEAVYSATGAVSLQIPAALIQETYSGGISRTACTVSAGDIPPLHFMGYKSGLYGTATWNRAAQTAIEPCRFYVRGSCLFVQGRFGKSGTVFFADNCKPAFLGWQSAAARIRAFLRFSLMRILYTWGDAGGLLLALFAADRSFLPKTCLAAFKNAGLSHILALSGMHISLISTAALQSSIFASGRKNAMRISLAAVCLFVWFAGSAPSLNRALGMLLITAAGNALYIRPSPLAVLSAMLFLHIICYAPDALTLGFMLSYGACAGIIIFSSAFSRGITAVTRGIPRCICESISASLAAQSFTAPIVIKAIGTISSAGVIASCIVSPLVSLFLIAGLVCIPIVSIIPQTAPVFALFFHILYAIIYQCAAFFARFPLITASNTAGQLLLGSVLLLSGLGVTVWAVVHRQKEKQLLLTLFTKSSAEHSTQPVQYQR